MVVGASIGRQAVFVHLRLTIIAGRHIPLRTELNFLSSRSHVVFVLFVSGPVL